VSREEAARRNREQMPTVAAWIDDIRKEFPNAKVVYAEENGHTVGRKTNVIESWPIPEGFRPSRPVQQIVAEAKKRQGKIAP
jgi:hypothetical protein